ncbi:MAG: hypothetical protein UV64_C0007G0008 [Parcubacteria group bacterium GW2011_GWC1_43_11b]|nr:MAG: hypothetical protein UV64_C0007G0008 [Parcubacteria group bacterium GW2011_GWC1_43_11b]
MDFSDAYVLMCEKAEEIQPCLHDVVGLCNAQKIQQKVGQKGLGKRMNEERH